MYSNLIDQEAAKAAAKRIFQKVNFSGGPLQSYQISSLMTETYEYLKIPFNPKSRDIKSYAEVLDVNRDGQVTLSDFQILAVEYLCGAGVLANKSPNSTVNKTKTDLTTNSYNITSSNVQPNNNATALQAKTQYSQQINQYIAKTKQIFQKHADQHFTITADRVPQLLAQTYQALGRKGFKSNEQDVKGWINLCDGNGDGHVEYDQFEYFVLRSLQRSGLPLYK